MQKVANVIWKAIYYFSFGSLALAWLVDLLPDSPLKEQIISLALDKTFRPVARWLLETYSLPQLLPRLFVLFTVFWFYFSLGALFEKEEMEPRFFWHVTFARAIEAWGNIAVAIFLFHYVSFGVAAIWLFIYLIAHISLSFYKKDH